MGVYVDDARYPLGRFLMSHMLADTTAELFEMADRLGLERRWVQFAGTAKEHFDIPQEKRAQDLALGAKAIPTRGLVLLIRSKRAAQSDETL